MVIGVEDVEGDVGGRAFEVRTQPKLRAVVTT